MVAAEDLVVVVRLDDGLLVRYRGVAGVDNLAIANHQAAVGTKTLP